MNNLSIIILAAGKGTRMQTATPKILHSIGGAPLLHHVYESAIALSPQHIYVVYGHAGDALKERSKMLNVKWVHQAEQLGTGHAVQQAIQDIPHADKVLILYADTPLVTTNSLSKLLASNTEQNLCIMTTELSHATGYGRILRDDIGAITAIVEEKDANAQQRAINEVNTGIMAANAGQLRDWLAKLNNNNAQQEYYLTDVVALAIAAGSPVHSVTPMSNTEIMGVNSLAELAQAERALQQRTAEQFMQQGTLIKDPNRFDLRGSLSVGKDCEIDINVLFEGSNSLGNAVTIGAHCIIKNAHIGDKTTILPYTFIDGASIGEHCQIGPYARIRPETNLHDKVQIGNFVEIKKSSIEQATKINHLSYIGDCDIGAEVNIGAGTITCNYDGKQKHKTRIGNHTFVGSDVQFIAPVNIGQHATIAAGTSVTCDVPDEALAISRKQQKNILQWKNRK